MVNAVNIPNNNIDEIDIFDDMQNNIFKISNEENFISQKEED